MALKWNVSLNKFSNYSYSVAEVVSVLKKTIQVWLCHRLVLDALEMLYIFVSI